MANLNVTYRRPADLKPRAANPRTHSKKQNRLVPKDGDLKIELYGELAALIALPNEHPRGKTSGVQVTLVAGAGFEPATFRL